MSCDSLMTERAWYNLSLNSVVVSWLTYSGIILCINMYRNIFSRCLCILSELKSGAVQFYCRYWDSSLYMAKTCAYLCQHCLHCWRRWIRRIYKDIKNELFTLNSYIARPKLPEYMTMRAQNYLLYPTDVRKIGQLALVLRCIRHSYKKLSYPQRKCASNVT